MKRLFFIIIAITLTSCEEQIDLDLNAAAPRLVVEGEVRNDGGPFILKLSRTTSYFNNQLFDPETNATVTVTDDATNTVYNFSEDKTGLFVNGGLYKSTFTGIPGHTYTLKVNTLKGESCSGTNILETPVAIDSLSSKIRPPRVGEDPANITERVVTCYFTDPPELGNYYGFRWGHGKVFKEITESRLIDDKFVNSHHLDATFRSDIKQGDTVAVQLITFNKTTYDFYNTLRKSLQAGSPFSSPPDDPVNNLSGNTMGFFGCYSGDVKIIIVK